MKVFFIDSCRIFPKFFSNSPFKKGRDALQIFFQDFPKIPLSLFLSKRIFLPKIPKIENTFPISRFPDEKLRDNCYLQKEKEERRGAGNK